MIIVDEPFVAPEFADWLEETQHPVLANAMARRLAAEGRALNLVDDETCARAVEGGERLYTASENALSWVAEHVGSEPMRHAISVFKDKALMRELLAPLCPGVFYRRVAAGDLRALDYGELPCPLVLKPSVGFCSVGVYVVEDRAQWEAALADIERNAETWRAWYPESVIGESEFIVESYISGQEYAIDAFYDEDGRAHVLNVLQHDFAGPEDTSDRLYFTGASVVRAWAPRFEEWLTRANERVGAKAFPAHVEVRVQDAAVKTGLTGTSVDGEGVAGGACASERAACTRPDNAEDAVVARTDFQIVPIEFNPLRFAGLCGTELAYFAYGFHTYDYYLNDVAPDWDALLAGKEGKLYCMSLLPAPACLPEGARFDAAGFATPLSRVLQCYEFDPRAVGSCAFVFCETDEYTAQGSAERRYLLTEDLERHIVGNA